MIIYGDSGRSSFGAVDYKSAYNRKVSNIHAKTVKRSTRHKAQKVKKNGKKRANKKKSLSVKNVKFLKSLGIKVKKH